MGQAESYIVLKTDPKKWWTNAEIQKGYRKILKVKQALTSTANANKRLFESGFAYRKEVKTKSSRVAEVFYKVKIK